MIYSWEHNDSHNTLNQLTRSTANQIHTTVSSSRTRKKTRAKPTKNYILALPREHAAQLFISHHFILSHHKHNTTQQNTSLRASRTGHSSSYRTCLLSVVSISRHIIRSHTTCYSRQRILCSIQQYYVFLPLSKNKGEYKTG